MHVIPTWNNTLAFAQFMLLTYTSENLFDAISPPPNIQKMHRKTLQFFLDSMFFQAWTAKEHTAVWESKFRPAQRQSSEEEGLLLS